MQYSKEQPNMNDQKLYTKVKYHKHHYRGDPPFELYFELIILTFFYLRREINKLKYINLFLRIKCFHLNTYKLNIYNFFIK